MLLLLVEDAHSTNAPGLLVVSPESLEVRHLRSREHEMEVLAALPGDLRGAEQIDRAFLNTVVRQMANNNLVCCDAPLSANPQTVAARTFRRIDTHAEEHQFLIGQTAIQQRGPLQFCLDENPICRAKQEEQRRRKIGPTHSILRIVRIAQVQKRSDQERHAQAACASQTAGNWPSVRKRRGMNEIKSFMRATGIGPHTGGDRIARQCQTLPHPPGQQRERLEEVTPSRPAPQRIAADFHVVFDGGTRR